MDYQHERHTIHLLVYPIMWCPKRRRLVLVGPMRDRVEQIGKGVVDENGRQIIRVAMQPDHVQWFIRSEVAMLPSAIQRLRKGHSKGRNPHLLREEFPYERNVPSQWTRSVFLSMTGTVSQ